MKREIIINTDKESLIKAEEFLNDFKSEYLLELKDGFMNILIAFTEAVNNAINHGNQKNPKKKIFIKLEKNENLLYIDVIDEGNGFLESDVPDPTLPENLLKQSGRGVFLIRKLADQMEIRSTGKGTEVKMGFKIV